MENPADQTNTEVIDPPVTEEAPKTESAATKEQVEQTNEILKGIQDQLKPKAEAAPNQDQVREMIKEKTGLSDAGVDWVIQMNRDSVSAAIAPVQEKMAWNEIKSSKASTPFPVTPEIEKAMQEELKQYPIQMRGDPVLLEKVYYVEVGKAAAKGQIPKKGDDAPNPVVRRTIVNNNPNPAGNSAASQAASAASKLSDQEKAIAKKMGVSEVDYAKSKGNPVVWAVPEKV